MIDVTEKYVNMIEAFECDFCLAEDDYNKLDYLKNMLITKDYKLLRDMELLKELSFNLRHNKTKIYEEENNE